MKQVYLDYAAATPVSSTVMQAMQPYFADIFYNPSALYAGAREAKRALEGARANIAQAIGAQAGEAIFTAGGTESANLAIKGVMEEFPDAEIIISAIEHEAVKKPAHLYDVRECPVDSSGRIDMAKLEKMITDKTVLISVMQANNEVGTIQPIAEITELVKQIRKSRIKSGVVLPLYVHTDACQSPLYININVASLGVDLMSLNGGKIYGPKQSGILYRRAGVRLNPQIIGGGQEMGLRSGTENVAAAVGFATALQEAVNNRIDAAKRLKEMTDNFAKQLEQRFAAEINGHRKYRLPNNLHATFPGADNERVLFALDQHGVWAASGSACSASNEEVSHVLSAMGVDENRARSSLRFSLGSGTTAEDLTYVLDVLEKALKA